jgi:NADP-dependent 3-hydroxy acid dehydrogenase YdfG
LKKFRRWEESDRLSAGYKNIKSFDAFIKQVGDHLEENTGSRNIDYLVNNAGTALYSPITEVTEEQLDDMVDIHFKGCFS